MRTESTRPIPQSPLIPNRPANTADVAEPSSHAEPNLAPSPTSNAPVDENHVEQQGPESDFDPNEQVFSMPGQSAVESVNPNSGSDENFQIASLRDKHNANLRNAQARRRSEIPKLLEELRQTTNPARKARILVNVGRAAGLISTLQAGKLHNQMAPFIRNPDAFTGQAKVDFGKQFRQAMETHRNNMRSQFEFDKKLNDALVITDADVMENIYQVVQLADIGPLKDLSTAIKEQALKTMDFAIETGMAGETNAAAVATFANTAVDFMLPTNIIDVISLGKGISAGIKSSRQTMKAVNEMATKEGEYFLKLDNGGHVRLSGKVNILTESQKKNLVLVKLLELEHIKTPNDLNRVKNELKQLLQHMSQRGENAGIIEFARNTMLLTSASYQGASDIFDNELYNASNSAKAYIDIVDSYLSSP